MPHKHIKVSDTTSLCRRCQQTKLTIEFHIVNKRSGRLNGYCKECANELARLSYALNKGNGKNKKAAIASTERKKKFRQLCKNFVDTVKAHYGCCFCKEKEPCCLDCHHLDPSAKEIQVTNCAHGSSKKRLFKELVKCVVICANCHRKLHKGLLTASADDLICLESFDTTF